MGLPCCSVFQRWHILMLTHSAADGPDPCLGCFYPLATSYSFPSIFLSTGGTNSRLEENLREPVLSFQHLGPAQMRLVANSLCAISTCCLFVFLGYKWNVPLAICIFYLGKYKSCVVCASVHMKYTNVCMSVHAGCGGPAPPQLSIFLL